MKIYVSRIKILKKTCNNISLQPKFTFKKWTRKAYAVFNSLHRYVIIAGLSFDVHGFFYKKIAAQIEEQLRYAEILQAIFKITALCFLMEKFQNQSNRRIFVFEY